MNARHETIAMQRIVDHLSDPRVVLRGHRPDARWNATTVHGYARSWEFIYQGTPAVAVSFEAGVPMVWIQGILDALNPSPGLPAVELNGGVR